MCFWGAVDDDQDDQDDIWKQVAWEGKERERGGAGFEKISPEFELGSGEKEEKVFTFDGLFSLDIIVMGNHPELV